jgi:hypothetical protein
MRKSKQTSAASDVTMVGVADLKGPRTGHLIIHFSGKQWQKATSRLKRVQLDPAKDKPPQGGVAFVPVGPDRPDLGTVVLPDPCGNGCVKKTWPREDGLGRCDCGKPGIPTPSAGDGGAPQNTRGCTVVLVGGTFKCVGVGCGRNCKPEVHQFNFGSRILLGFVVCRCT